MAAWGQVPDDGDFPDIEHALILWLASEIDELATVGGVRHVNDRTPSNLEDVTPFVRVSVWGGDDDRITDSPRVDIDTFTLDRTTGYALAERIRTMIRGAPRRVGDSSLSVYIDRAQTINRPTWVPWEDGSPIHRRLATYDLDLRH